MNDEFLRQLSPEDQTVSEVLQSKAESIRVNPQFQSNLEARLKASHPTNIQPEQSWGARILPAIGWAILAIGAFLVLNWAIQSLVPNVQPATNGTPNPEIPFERGVKTGDICSGQLAVAHGFSVSITNEDKTGLVPLDAQKDIDELRSFAWSPDGKQLALVGNTRGSGNLYLTDSAGNSLQQVFTDTQFGYLAGVAWSNSGEKLLTWEISNNTRAFLVDLNGTGAAVLNLPLHFIETPKFAPDDQSILFLGADSTSSGLFKVTVDGSSQVSMISKLVEHDSSFAWSPDGSRLAYVEMDRDLGEARLVIESNGSKNPVATLPIPKGSGSSIPESANLSWSPDGNSLVFEFGRNASDRSIYLAKLDGTGLVQFAESAHAPAISPDGKCLAYISKDQVFLLDLSMSSSTEVAPVLLADLPAGRGRTDFQLDQLGWGAAPTLATNVQTENIPVPTPLPSGTEYDWRGTKLYLSAPLPDTPTQANVYQLQPAPLATMEGARVLAQRFGIAGEIYQAPGELPDTRQFLVTDGKQRLYIRSEQYFTYYADYANYSVDMFSSHEPLSPEQAANSIDGFLKEHGYDFPYQIENAPQIINHYYVVPLSPDSLPLRYDYLMPVRLEIKLDASGKVIFMQSHLIEYEQISTFGLRTAQEAWQKVLDDNGAGGTQESFRAGGILEEYYWQRAYPENQTVTIYGRVSAFPPAEAVGTPFVSIGEYTATGNTSGLEALEASTLIQANGKFFTENGIRKFVIETWEISNGEETSLTGVLHREGDQVVLTSEYGGQYSIADVPADAPFEKQLEDGQLNVGGVLTDGVFDWSVLQYFPADSMRGGGGGGGGGAGFHKLNLTGAPVPLPTPHLQQESSTGTGNYVVQEGDTLAGIAEIFGITVDELMQLNGLADPTIFIGQTLVVPTAQPESSPVGQKIEGQRGILLAEIYRQADGSQQIVYSLLSPRSSQYNYFVLSGDGLDGLEKYHNRPVDIWGTIESAGGDSGMVVHVDRYEVPFPDLQFQILRGVEEQVTLEGQVVTLFTTTEGQTYVKFTLDGNLEEFILGKSGDEVLYEALVVPGETFGGYPAVRVYSTGFAANPETGQPADMQITADQPSILEGPIRTEHYVAPSPPTLTVEKVELVYYTTDPRYVIPDPATGPGYLQPVWRFYGHFSTGDEFEMLVQALKDEFLLPDLETIQGPG